MTRVLFYTILMILIVFSAPTIAAPAVAAPECQATGRVLSVARRDHVYEPRSWADSWGLPKSITYIDVSIDVRDVQRRDLTMVGVCDHTLGERVFQLDNGVEQPDIGKCIKAVTHLSGDEFRIGNWLKSYDVLADSDCALSGTRDE